MKFEELIQGIDVQESAGPSGVNREVTDVVSDSRDVKPGALFVAVAGVEADGHRYISAACQKGAAVVVLQDRRSLRDVSSGVTACVVSDTQAALRHLVSRFFDFPYRRIQAIGITGTNGKTTISYLVRSVLEAAGHRCGLIGTIGYKVAQDNLPTGNTTPGIVELHRMVHQMIQAGDSHVAMEVSSHALDQGRVQGMVFKATIFTNLTQDHLDYHKTMEAYFEAKKKLFLDHADARTAHIINADDPYGQRLLSLLKGRVFDYGFSPSCRVAVASYHLDREGTRLTVRTPSGDLDLRSRLVGRHNVYNILAAVAFGVSEGLSLPVIRRGIEGVLCVPGRLDRIDSPRGFSVFVDYAHTDDALKNVLESLRQIPHNGRIITVFGCGGDRDKGKRPKMGRVATDLSDFCFITSDNPRSEEPRDIIAGIVSGIQKKDFEIIEDRAEAIRRALTMAGPGDLVLLAGKGHEAYQIARGRTVPFDDKVIAARILAEMGDHV
jgi:UDP-N-acetylmuramoyl-L-alanyl-D-glutamate--2,6-diaminopimelate ligase